MIIGVFGLPGAGKSTFLASAAQHFLSGKSFMGLKPSKIVFTNFYCDGCYKLDFDKLGIYNFVDCNILIDEIMLLADTRNFKSFPESLKRFFSQHRKTLGDGHGVIWCSQYYDDCDKKIRVLTHKYYLLEKGRILTNFSFVKPILREMRPKRGCMNDQFILGAPITWRAIYRPKYYKIFDSYETLLKHLPPVKLIPWNDAEEQPSSSRSERAEEQPSSSRPARAEEQPSSSRPALAEEQPSSSRPARSEEQPSSRTSMPERRAE